MALVDVSKIQKPGAVSKPYANVLPLTALQLAKPQYATKFFSKFGAENFAIWLQVYAGKRAIKGDTFTHFESVGKKMLSFSVAADVTSTGNGTNVTVTLATEDHTNSGTESPIRVGETVRSASGNQEAKIIAVNKSTPNAHTATLRPSRSDVNLMTRGAANIALGEVFYLAGQTEAGEASGGIDPQVPREEKISNTTTEVRDTWKASDFAEMTETWYEGVPGTMPAGGEQAGDSQYTKRGLIEMDERFMNNLEFKLMFGDIMNNTGLTNSKGTKGMFPQIEAGGQTIGYTPGGIDRSVLHAICRFADAYGSAESFMWMMDWMQRADIDDTIFDMFPAGSWVWGKNERGQEAAVTFGVESIKIDGRLFKLKKYNGFAPEIVYGKSPDTAFYRHYGSIMPEGTTTDIRSGQIMKSFEVMYQPPVGGGRTQNGIRVWRHGGGSMNPTDDVMADSIHQITYQGMRITGAQQFITVTAR